MAQSDAIMDYSNNGHYSTAAKAADVLAVWEANKNKAFSIQSSHAWSGDTTLAPSTPLSGWDEETWKLLYLLDCPHDPTYQLPEPTPAHTMLRNLKTMFNLPNQGTDSDWEDEYSAHWVANIEEGECTYFYYVSKDVVSMPMMLSKSSMVSADTGSAWPAGAPLGVGNNVKCVLKIGLQGWDLDVGVGRGLSFTARPDDDVAAYNAHYKALADAGTLAADYTSPSPVGEEYVVEGNILLINCENQHRPTTLSADTDRVTLCISYSNHTYAQIKALIDAAIA